MSILGWFFGRRKQNAEVLKVKEDTAVLLVLRKKALAASAAEKQAAFEGLARAARDSRYHRVARLVLWGAINDPANWDPRVDVYVSALERSLAGDEEGRKAVGKIDLIARKTLPDLAKLFDEEALKTVSLSEVQQEANRIETERAEAHPYLEAAQKIQASLSRERDPTKLSRLRSQIVILAQTAEIPYVTRLEMLDPNSALVVQWEAVLNLMKTDNDLRLNLERIETRMKTELKQRLANMRAQGRARAA